MKVIIAGSRTFNNYDLLERVLQEENLIIEEVVCGGARGADDHGQKWARNNGVSVKYFNAEWEKYGRVAGIIRNHEMGDYADYLIAFWDGKSRGTKDMIDYMQQLGKHGKVVLFKNEQ
jgi:hypothetical protein